MMTGKQIEEANNDKNGQRKQHRSVGHSVEVDGERIKIQANRIPNQGSRQRTTVEEFVTATEQACRTLPITKSEQLRHQAAGILKTAKLPKPSINRKKRQVQQELKKEKV